MRGPLGTATDARLIVAAGATARASGAGAAFPDAPLCAWGAASGATPSSSTIVTVPVRLAIVAPDGFESTTLNCSVGSAVLLFTIVTTKVITVTPTANVSVAVRVW